MMKNLLVKFSRKFGFTATETNVILFVISAFLVGLGLNVTKSLSGGKTIPEFNYQREDSLFNLSGNSVSDSSVNVDSVSNRKKGLPKFRFGRSVKKAVPGKVININSGSISDLSSLPGIGPKTALRILEYRKKHGSFRNVDELMNVKGIGALKLSKFRNLVSLD